MNSNYLIKKATPQEYPQIGLLEYNNIIETDPEKEICLDHFCKSTSSMANDPNTFYFFISDISVPGTNQAGGGFVLSLDPFYVTRGELQAFFVLKAGRRKGHASTIIKRIKKTGREDHKVGIWNTNIFSLNTPSINLFTKKHSFKEELKSYYFSYVDFMSLPNNKISASTQFRKYHTSVTEKLKNSVKLEERESLEILWDFEYEMSFLDSTYNMSQFTGLPNLLDRQRPLLKQDVFEKYVLGLDKAYKSNSPTYLDQSFALILKAGNVLGFIATSNQSHFLGGLRMVRITSLCLYNEDLSHQALIAGILSINEILVPRYCSANLRLDLPDNIRGFDEINQDLKNIGMDCIPYNTYTCRSN